MEDAAAERDWGNVRFRPGQRLTSGKRGEDDAWTRFVIGAVVFVAVAAIYPWYSYAVQARLMARDLEAAAKVWEKDAAKLERQIMQEWNSTQQSPPAPSLSATPRMVRVVGVSQNRSGPVAIVQLDGEEAGQHSRLICSQAAVMLRAPVNGQYLRIQRHRGSAPAQEAGRILC